MYYLIELYRKIYQKIWVLFHENLIEQSDQLIPPGIYCYERREYDKINGVSSPCILRTIPCRFYKLVPRGVQNDLCLLDGSDCMGDACKTCGINEPNDETWEVIYRKDIEHIDGFAHLRK